MPAVADTAAAMATRDAEELPTRSAAANEQAALLQIAMLIVHDALLEAVFGAVAEQAARRLRAEAAVVLRFVGDERAVVVGVWREGGIRGFPVNAELDFDSRNSAAGRVRSTGRPARADRYDASTGDLPLSDASDRCAVLGRRAGDGLGRGLGHGGRRHHAQRAASGGQRAPNRRPRRARGGCRRARAVPPWSGGFAPQDRRGRRRGTPPVSSATCTRALSSTCSPSRSSCG